MKRARLFLAVIISLWGISSPASASEFCDGFERGYITGYKLTADTSFKPFTPFCPFQPLKKFSDPESDFEHGYVIGLQQGQADGYKAQQ